MARYDDLNTSAIAYATLISTIVFVIVVLLVRALCYYWVEGELDRKLADAHYVSADAEISDQKERISGYQKVIETPDEQSGEPAEGDAKPAEPVEKFLIPVETAKDLLLEELTGDKGPGA